MSNEDIYATSPASPDPAIVAMKMEPPEDPVECLFYGIEKNDVDAVRWALGFQPCLAADRERGLPSALWTAVDLASPEVVLLLLRSGADVHERDLPISKEGLEYDYTHQPVLTLLQWAILQRDVQKVTLLLLHGADPNGVDESGNSALQYAVNAENLKVLEEMLRRGARLDAPSDNFPGNFPLHDAVQVGNGDIVKMMLAYGASPSLRNAQGHTPLHVLAQAAHDSPALAQELLIMGASVDETTLELYTPLHLAIEYHRHALIRALLKKGANMEARTCHGHTALMLATRCGNQKLVELLLERGADVTARDSEGNLALHAATTIGHVGIANALLAHGCDVDVLDGQRRTAYHLATEAGNREMRHLLLSLGANEWATNLEGEGELSFEAKVDLDSSVDSDVLMDSEISSTQCEFQDLSELL